MSEMKLWELWRDGTGYDEVYHIVVRASNEEVARKLAAEESCDEGEDTWLNPKKSKCEMLKVDGKACVIAVCHLDG